MKKLLLASTALVATAGVAAADVAITGYAEIGVIGGDRYASSGDPDGDRAQWHTDIDVTFSMSGETDGGLAFGAIIDLDESDDGDAFNAQTQGGETYFLSFGGMRLDAGDTDGAYDAALQEINLAGASIADDETEHSGFNGNSGLDGTYDGQIVRASYSVSGFTAGISAEMDDSGEGDPVWGLGLRYTTDFGGTAIGVGLGYQTIADFGDVVDDTDFSDIGDVSLIGVSLDAQFANGFGAAVNYAEADLDGETGTYWGIGLGYTMNALAVGVNYGEYDDWAVNGDAADASGFGIAATYDLGGGMAAHFGYGESSGVDGAVLDGSDEDSYSFGLSMSF